MEFTIQTLKGEIINIHTEPYEYGEENFVAKVYRGGKCIYTDIFPDGISALNKCNEILK